MAKSIIRIEIVTPAGVAYSEDVEHAVVPTANGKIDIHVNGIYEPFKVIQEFAASSGNHG